MKIKHIIVEDSDPCWDTHKQVGMKKGKGGKPVPKCVPKEGVAEDFNGEYDDEAGMAETNLITIARAAQGLLDTIDSQENLPEWVQEKIAKVEGMMVTAWDYLKSQEAQGIDPRMGMTQVSLNEFAPDNGDDERSILLQLADELASALYGRNKSKEKVKEVMGQIRTRGGDVKISWNPDSTMNVAMFHPQYFKQGHLIRLVGKSDEELSEGAEVNYDLTPNYPNYRVLIGKRVGGNNDRHRYKIVSAELKPGQGATKKISDALLNNTRISIERSRSENLKPVMEDNENNDIELLKSGRKTSDGISMQDIRLMAGEGRLTKRTIIQALSVIRKQRRK